MIKRCVSSWRTATETFLMQAVSLIYVNVVIKTVEDAKKTNSTGSHQKMWLVGVNMDPIVR